MEFATKYSC